MEFQAFENGGRAATYSGRVSHTRGGEFEIPANFAAQHNAHFRGQMDPQALTDS
jgi:hypothetical protein